MLISLLLTVYTVEAQNTGTVSFNGFTFRIPDGWQGAAGAGVYVLASVTEPGVVLISPAGFSSMQELVLELSQSQSDGVSVSLHPAGPVEDLNSRSRGAEFSGTMNNEEVVMYMAGYLGENQNGLTFLAGTTSGQYSKRYRELIRQIVLSMEMTAPGDDGSQLTGSLNTWEKLYADTRLTYIDSYYSSDYGDVSGGYRDLVTIDLCAGGYFRYSSDFEMSGGGGAATFGSSDMQSESGRWAIRPVDEMTAMLILKLHNGQTKSFTLTRDANDYTYLNGERFYRTSRQDGPDYAPECY